MIVLGIDPGYAIVGYGIIEMKGNRYRTLEHGAVTAEARGVILLAAQKAGVPVFEYTPVQVKLAVTGYGKALKPQVMEMTRRLLCLKAVPKPDDTADALAVAICHCQASGTALRQFLR